MSRMILLTTLVWTFGSGCAVTPFGPCHKVGGRFCGAGCDTGCGDCVPPCVPYFGHYKQRLDDCVTRETARHCAWRALHAYRCHGSVSCDFAAGFEQAYIDLAENRAPQPPSVPPPKYWSAYYRSCAGRPHIDDWFAGYQAGLDQGSQSGVSRFNRIDVRMFGDGCVSGSAL